MVFAIEQTGGADAQSERVDECFCFEEPVVSIKEQGGEKKQGNIGNGEKST